MRIGDVSQSEEISIDTLRYYEKIGLMGEISRTPNGQRSYSHSDIENLRFIRRAQQVGFSLKEIEQLLSLRENPDSLKPQIRDMVNENISRIEYQITELSSLRDELSDLSQRCEASDKGCPIIESFEGKN